MKIQYKPTITMLLAHVPSGKAFTDRKWEENYEETLPENMHVSSKKEGGVSQLSFYHKVKDILGTNVKARIMHGSGKNRVVEEIEAGSPEAVRERLYYWFLRADTRLRKICKVEIESNEH